MAEDTVTIEAEAKALGWVPKEEFRGDGGKEWVDAETFVKKGREILPIVQKNNERLLRENADLKARVDAQESASKAHAAALKVLQDSHDEDSKAQVEAAKEELKDAMASALEAGDHKAVAELTGKMVKLESAEEKAAVKAQADADALTRGGGNTKDMPKLHPEVEAWFNSHKDFMASPRKVALSNAIAAEMRAKGDKRIGKEFLDDVQQETETALAGGQKRGGDGKVESSAGGGNRGSSDEKTFSDLPADAKEICDRQANKVVGPGRAHKDMASWRKSYVRQYFAE